MQEAPTEEEQLKKYQTELKNYSETCIRKIESWSWGFKTFNDPELMKMLKQVKYFVYCYMMNLAEPSNDEYKPRWISLLGKSEVGKTFLLGKLFQFISQEVCHSWIPELKAEKHKFVASTVFFQDTLDFVDEAMSDYGYIKHVFNSNNIIMLDEIQPNVSEVKREKLIHLLQKMSGSSLRKWRWGAFSANLTIAEIEVNFGTKIRSRFERESNVVVEVQNATPFESR